MDTRQTNLQNMCFNNKTIQHVWSRWYCPLFVGMNLPIYQPLFAQKERVNGKKKTAPVLRLPRSDEENAKLWRVPGGGPSRRLHHHYWLKHAATNIDGMGKLSSIYI